MNFLEVDPEVEVVLDAAEVALDVAEVALDVDEVVQEEVAVAQLPRIVAEADRDLLVVHDLDQGRFKFQTNFFCFSVFIKILIS